MQYITCTIKPKTTQERFLKPTLHIWSSSFYIHRRKLEKDRSWLKRERNFAQKTNAHLWRRCMAIYAPFFQIMRLWRRARGYPNPCPGVGVRVHVRVRVGVGGVDKNFNLGHNFQTIKDKAFILHMCISYDKTSHMQGSKLTFSTYWPTGPV